MSAVRRLVTRVRNAAPVAYAPTSGSPFAAPAPPSGMNAYSAVSTLFSIVHRLCTAAGSVEWCMYQVPRTQRREGDQERVQVMQHPALDLWTTPNPHMTQREVVEAWVQHSDLAGDGFLAVEGMDQVGFPLELWPLRPDRMRPIPSRENYLDGWVLLDAAGDEIGFEPGEILQMKYGPNPNDPYRGMGPVATLLAVLHSQLAAQQWNAMFFENGATPRGAWSIPDEVDDEEIKRFRRRLREQHGGVRNAHRDIVVANGAKYEAIQFNAKDMQLIEQYGVNRDIILEAYGMSRTMLGAAESETNRATAETAEYVFAKYQLVERLDRIKEILNTRLLPLFGVSAQGVEFDYHSPVPEDEESERADRSSRVEGATKLVTAGFDPAASLAAMGLPAIPFARQEAPA